MLGLIPLKGLPTAMESAELLFQHVFRYFGIPEDIVSDRGPQFISRVWKSFFKLLNVTPSVSPTRPGEETPPLDEETTSTPSGNYWIPDVEAGGEGLIGFRSLVWVLSATDTLSVRSRLSKYIAKYI